MILVLPAATPVTTPDAFTVAIAVLPELHVPPATVLLREVAEPVQTEVVPVMAVGMVAMVSERVACEPQPVV